MRQPVPFGKYLLLDRVSVGGMAEVFRAKSYGVEGFEKVIAIKRILPAMGEDKDFIKMFIDEAKIAGQLSHANICHIFELGKIGGSHFIAMEYIWGKDLLQIQNRLRKVGQVMPVGMACYVIAKVCEGLDYAHRKKDAMGRPLEIIHRDCSPQNVLVSYEGEVKLIDFGIARAASRSSRTNAGVLKGKFGYMSPEQVRGLPLDHRSDLFAVGTCFYESLTGERLFLGESDFSTLEKVRNADIRPPSQLNRSIPPEVEAIVMRALARDPKARFESGAEMHAALQSYLTRQAVPSTNKSLADWLRHAFKDDLEREKQQMEEYKRIGRDGLIAGVPQARAQVDFLEELGPPPPLEGEPTTLEGPSFEDMTAEELDAWLKAFPSGAPEPGSQPAIERKPAVGGALPRGKAVRPASEHGDWEQEESPTEVFGDIGAAVLAMRGRPGPAPQVAAAPRPAAAPPPMPGPRPPGPVARDPHAPLGRTHRGPGFPLASIPLPAGPPPASHPSPSHPHEIAGQGQRAPAHLRPPGTLPPPPFYPAAEQSPVVYAAVPGPVPYPAPYPPHLEPAFASQGIPVRPHTAGMLWRRATASRDVAIGCAIAALVLAAFVSVKFLVFGDEPRAEAEAAATGTILVVVRDALPAEVTVDGRVAGAIRDQSPLTLSALPAGSHSVQVNRAGAPPCERTVALGSRKVEVVECTFPKAPTHGRLILVGIEPKYRVFVDDQEISGEAAREPLNLTPGVEHSIQIKSGMEAPETVEEFAVELEPGQEMRRELKPSKPGARSKEREASNRSGAASSQKAADRPAADPPDEDPASASPSASETSSGPASAAVAAAPLSGSPASGSPPFSPDQTGTFTAFTDPFARVIIDGKDTGKMTPIPPRSALTLPAGPHTVSFVVGDHTFSYRIKIIAGERNNVVRTLRVVQ